MSKRLKKLTRREREQLSHLHLNWMDWGKVKDLSEQFIVIQHRETGARKTVDMWQRNWV